MLLPRWHHPSHPLRLARLPTLQLNNIKQSQCLLSALRETPTSISSTTLPQTSESATSSRSTSSPDGTTRTLITCSTPGAESYPPNKSPSLSHPAAIGASIGAASAFTLLLALSFLLYRENKRRIELENVIIDASHGRVPLKLG